MTRTYAEAIARIRTINGDRKKTRWSDDEIAGWLVDAQIRVAGYTETAQTVVTLNSTAGDGEWTLTDGFLRVREVYYDGMLVHPTTLETLNQLYPNRLIPPIPRGLPYLYYLAADTINFYPAPDATGRQQRALIVPRPADYADTSTEFNIPDEMFETLVRYGLQMSKETDQDWVGAGYFKQDFKERVMENSYQEAVKGIDSYPAIRSIPDDW